MARFIYIDNSNVFIEGQRVAAVNGGYALDMDDAQRRGIFYGGYRLDFGKLYNFLTRNGDPEIKRVALFGSRPPPNDSLWEIAKRKGFEPIIEDRSPSNREKKIDTGIVVAMMEDAYKRADKVADSFTLVAGDSDYVPAVRALIESGFTVNITFWRHASRELQRTGSKFIDMDPHFNALALKDERKT